MLQAAHEGDIWGGGGVDIWLVLFFRPVVTHFVPEDNLELLTPYDTVLPSYRRKVGKQS